MNLLSQYLFKLDVDARTAYRTEVLDLLEHDPQAKLLDLGCGQLQRLTLAAANRIGTTKLPYGIDLNYYDSDEVKVRVRDLEDPLPFADNVFDVVIASQIIEHLKGTDQLIRETYRVLKPKGYAVFSTPNLAAWHNILYLSLGKQPGVTTASEEMYPWKERPGHLRVFTATELLATLRFHSFLVRNVVGSTYAPFWGKTARHLARLDWRHAGTITVRASKWPS